MSDVKYAGFWIRVIASLIDTFLMIMVFAPLAYLLGNFGDVAVVGSLLWLMFLVVVNLLPIVAIFVFWILKSATPGKLLFNLIIVDANNGEVPTISQWVVRYVGYFVAMIPFFLGIFWIGIDKRKQGLHDKLARTVVVQKTRERIAQS